MKDEIWIGLVNVVPRKGNTFLHDAVGAYVSALVIAKNAAEFCSSVRHQMDQYEFDVIGIDDIELYRERILRCKVAEVIDELSKGLNDCNPIGFGTFHSYKTEE